MAPLPPTVTPLHPHRGHAPILQALGRARVRGSLPSTLLIHGSRGVGKQHLALWLGQLLLCTAPAEQGPCGECRDCRLARRIEHPDLHWFFPLPRPERVSSPEKLAEALEEARGAALQELRRDPLRLPPSGESRVLYLAAARTLRHQAQRKPSMGAGQIFLVADAETLAPQESSSEAANALLKLLEEPPAGTTLILTSSEPGRLLPTIRSRTAHLHLPPLAPEEVRSFLVEVAGASAEVAGRLAVLSQGSIGRALGFWEREEGAPSPLAPIRDQALSLLDATLSSSSASLFQASLEFKPVGARGLGELLDFLEEGLRDLALLATGAPLPPWHGRGPEPNARDPRLQGVGPEAVADAVAAVEGARSMAAGNVNPQLLVFGLLHEIRRRFRGAGTTSSS